MNRVRRSLAESATDPDQDELIGDIMNLRTRSLLLLAALLWLMGVGLARGGWPCRLCCKSQAECEPCDQPQYVCKPVCEKKAINKTIYRVKCIPYCRHNCPCSCCKECCDSCDACVYYRKVLVKKSVKAGEVDVVHCKVQEVCPECGEPAGPQAVPVHPSIKKPLVPHERLTPEPAPKPTREVPAKSASARAENVNPGIAAPSPEEAY